MNDLQKKEFELLTHFIEICEKLDLTYYLMCGSALGAVKYGGFIPWDDDVDVALPRDDYEKFLSTAPEMLPEHLFLQNYRTDPEFPKVFSKLRDSRTTYIEKDYCHLNINHGVFIDIFALDGHPQEESEIKGFEKKKKCFLRTTSCALAPNGSFKSKMLRSVLRLLGCHKRTVTLLSEYEAMIKRFSDTDVYCNYGNFRGKMEISPKALYGEGSFFPFETLTVRVPSMYDKYLREKYGDYTKDPPTEEQQGHHYYYALDLDKPYTEYVNIRKKR